MNIKKYTGKTESELLSQALNELNLTEDEVLYSIKTEHTGLLKKEVLILELVTQDDIIDYSKEFLNELLTLMGLTISLETKKKDNQIYINIISDNNSILIGKNGQTLSSLNSILKQTINSKIGSNPHITLDAGNYKENKDKKLEKLATSLANDVARTKVEVELENMNSYDRRIIHNALSNNPKVYTESIGEEPNRHIVIKPKEE